LPVEQLFLSRSIQSSSLWDAPAEDVLPSGSRPESFREDAMRNAARFSDETSVRLEAIDRLADRAADAIRTLRGLTDDDDPVISREARRLLRELDVPLREE
jgi:hypothetical protein